MYCMPRLQFVLPLLNQENIFFLKLCIFSFLTDHQKLEREARICRLLKHPNIGKNIEGYIHWESQDNQLEDSSIKVRDKRGKAIIVLLWCSSVVRHKLLSDVDIIINGGQLTGTSLTSHSHNLFLLSTYPQELMAISVFLKH